MDENAAMAQLVEHILGKDEVPGPNPGSSSKQPRSTRASGLWFFIGVSNDTFPNLLSSEVKRMFIRSSYSLRLEYIKFVGKSVVALLTPSFL